MGRCKKKESQKFWIILFLVVFLCNTTHEKDDYMKEFLHFCEIYNKPYSSKGYLFNKKYEIFKSNYNHIENLNSKLPNTSQFKYSVTKFMDVSMKEFSRTHLMSRERKKNNLVKPEIEISKWKNDNSKKIPKEFDWSDHGAVTAVKNQGDCGSCWAFSTIGNLEAVYFHHSKELVDLSPQQLVDCDEMEDACAGGYLDNAFWYFTKWLVETEKDYPYTGEEHYCLYKEKKGLFKLSSYKKLKQNETYMKEYLYSNEPISVTLNADDWQFYKEGIWDPQECDETVLNHAVLITGYGVENDTKFWMIKNSWGSDWGEQGFLRLKRGEKKCGVEKTPYTSKI